MREPRGLGQSTCDMRVWSQTTSSGPAYGSCKHGFFFLEGGWFLSHSPLQLAESAYGCGNSGRPAYGSFLCVFAVAAAIIPTLPSPAPGEAAGRAPRKSVPVLKRVVVSRPAGRNS